MVREDWSEWAVIQLQECIINDIGPDETAALLGRAKEEVYAKARELDLLLPPAFQDSPPTVPDEDDKIFAPHRRELEAFDQGGHFNFLAPLVNELVGLFAEVPTPTAVSDVQFVMTVPDPFRLGVGSVRANSVLQQATLRE